MAQENNLRVVLEESRDIFQEMAFEMPQRISEKGFRWLALYTLALSTLPAFLRAVLEGTRSEYWAVPFQVFGPVLIALLAALTLAFFI